LTEDTDLTEALAGDLDGAFERLVLTYQDRLYRFGLRLTASPQDAEEIAQDAFVRAYRALGGYPGERIRALLLRPWLYRIALNVYHNRVRRKQVQAVPLDGHLELPVTIDLPEDIALQTERVQTLALQLAALPERFRPAVVLRHVEGLSYPEIAAILDCPVGTVKANVHRGVLTLRSALTHEKSEVTA